MLVIFYKEFINALRKLGYENRRNVRTSLEVGFLLYCNETYIVYMDEEGSRDRAEEWICILKAAGFKCEAK